MVRKVITDERFLSDKSVSATAEDICIADDLRDTLAANSEKCVGMAANMIGESKCIIVFDDDGEYAEMFNPVILKKTEPYETEEGCLSLAGKRKTKRYSKIKVQWQDRLFRRRIKNFEGFTAQIIQHELDHLDGIII